MFTVQCYTSMVCAVIMCLSICLSVCLSITCQYCVKTAKLRIVQTVPCDSPEILIFWSQRSWRNSNGVTHKTYLLDRFVTLILALFRTLDLHLLEVSFVFHAIGLLNTEHLSWCHIVILLTLWYILWWWCVLVCVPLCVYLCVCFIQRNSAWSGSVAATVECQKSCSVSCQTDKH